MPRLLALGRDCREVSRRRRLVAIRLQRCVFPTTWATGTGLALQDLVTVRITIVEDPVVRRIRLEGHLSAAEIGELDQAIGDDPSGACLELENLRSADAAGLAALRRLRAEGVELRSVPPHLAWRIEGEPAA